MEKKYDEQFAVVFDAIKQLIADDQSRKKLPRRRIGFQFADCGLNHSACVASLNRTNGAPEASPQRNQLGEVQFDHLEAAPAQ